MASHGPWKDATQCTSPSDIHAPKYFANGWADFGADLKNFDGELILKDVLTKEMYEKYEKKTTSLGVTIDKCIKGGVDKAKLGSEWNVGKVGLLFGDAECVETFPDLIDPIMIERHNKPKLPHPPPNLDGTKLLNHSIIDASYVISTRVRTGRSISGFPLPPSISADQRKELEEIVVGALLGLKGDMKGDYYPLAGSTTYAPKPTGIDKETEKRLVEDHFLFQEPEEPMLLSWRMERDWPHARGIYHNENKNALVWVNEEDHLRIISMQKGPNIREVFDRFALLVNAVEAACKGAGRGLEISEKYGNILSCPSNCGTGLRASMMIKIPLASKEPSFKKWCADRSLQARGSGGFASEAKDDGIRDVSNVDRMGKDEVTLVNEMIRGVADLIAWEKELEAKAQSVSSRKGNTAVPEEQTALQFRALMIGEASVGKTSLSRCYEGIDLPKHSMPTFGSEMTSKVETLENGKKVKFQVVDTAGTERYRATSASYYNNASGALLVYDVTLEESLENCQYWLDQMTERALPNFVICLVGNKVDLALDDASKRKVSAEAVNEFVQRNKISMHIETSAVTSMNVKEAFKGLLQKIYNRTIEGSEEPEAPVEVGGGGSAPPAPPTTPSGFQLGGRNNNTPTGAAVGGQNGCAC